MECRILYSNARSTVLEIADGGRYETCCPYDVYLNGAWKQRTERVITSLFGLRPDTEYTVEVVSAKAVPFSGPEEQKAHGKVIAAVLKEERGVCTFKTLYESVTLDVRNFGARGDGQTDDTLALQAAVMACPADGRVLVPKGRYRFHCLFLKSGLNLCLEEDAVLAAFGSPDQVPLVPGAVQHYDEKGELLLGTWEGNPLPMHTGIVAGYNVENVSIYGQGCIDGGGSRQTWWRKEYIKSLPARPRLLFLSHSRNITLQGIKVMNSPSWTIHPFFSENISLYGCEIINPADSPNTDGIDPESCRKVEIIGVRICVGDDCIAVKAGKLYMGRTFRRPSTELTIRQCLFEEGHGAVTIGSEMAGGVQHLHVQDCIFRDTDRGLRIKTRRGRGKDAIVDDVAFEGIRMEGVKTPIVVNCFYYCDPDGHTTYVQDRRPVPADERTPGIKRLIFRDLNCTGCHVQAAWIEGLPEAKIEEVCFENVHISFAEDAAPGVPAMTEGAEERSLCGVQIAGVKRICIRGLRIEGQEGRSVMVHRPMVRQTGDSDEKILQL